MVVGLGLGTIVIIVALVSVMSFKVLREYQRAVVFTLDHFKVKGPSFFLLIPVVQQMVRIDLRTVVMDVPPQDVITRDIIQRARYLPPNREAKCSVCSRGSKPRKHACLSRLTCARRSARARRGP